jgi:hypothetical protein
MPQRRCHYDFGSLPSHAQVRRGKYFENTAAPRLHLSPTILFTHYTRGEIDRLRHFNAEVIAFERYAM